MIISMIYPFNRDPLSEVQILFVFKEAGLVELPRHAQKTPP